MKYLLIFFSVIVIATSCNAQQKPVYERTRTQQVLSDYATRSVYFLGIPSGPVPGFPSWVPDSVKCGALYNKTTVGAADSLKVYDCHAHTWNNAGSGRVGNFDTLHVVHGASIAGNLNINGNLSLNGSGFNALGQVIVGGGDWYGQLQLRSDGGGSSGPGRLRFSNTTTAGYDYFIEQDNASVGPSSLLIFGNGGQIKITADDIYDSHNNQFLKSSSGGFASTVFGRSGAIVAQSGDYNTGQVTESGNLYFTQARVLATPLTGYTSAAGTLGTTDNIVQAFGKINGNIANNTSSIGTNTTNITTLQGQHTSDYAAIGLRQPKIIPANPGAASSTIATGDSTNMALWKLQAQVNTNNTAISGKQATLTGPGYVKMVSGSPTYINSILNADLANSSITFNGTSTALGGSFTVTKNNTDTTNTGFATHSLLNTYLTKATIVSTYATIASLPNFAFTSPTVVTPSLSDSSGLVVNSKWAKQLAASQVQYFTSGMFGHTGSAADPFQYGTASIPMTALNATGTFNAANVLHQDGTWSAISAGFTNPMTNAGDIMYGASGGAATRLAIGGANTVLHGGSTAPSYSNIVQGDVNNGYIDLSSTQTGIAGNKTLNGIWTFSSTNTASSGTTNYGTIFTHIGNQTSTAGFTDIFLNSTGTFGTGAHNLVDLWYQGVSKFSINSSGQILSNAGFNGGNITSGSYNQTVGTSVNMVFLTNYAPADATHQSLYSPDITFNHPVWNTSGTPAQNYINWRLRSESVGGATPSTSMVLYSSLSTTTTPSYLARFTVDGLGNVIAGKSVRGTAVTFSNVPSTAVEGMHIPVTDSTTATYGATITGGGTNHVNAYYNGTNWIVD